MWQRNYLSQCDYCLYSGLAVALTLFLIIIHKHSQFEIYTHKHTHIQRVRSWSPTSPIYYACCALRCYYNWMQKCVCSYLLESISMVILLSHRCIAPHYSWMAFSGLSIIFYFRFSIFSNGIVRYSCCVGALL